MNYFKNFKSLCLLIVSIMILQLAMPMSFALGHDGSYVGAGDYLDGTTGSAINGTVGSIKKATSTTPQAMEVPENRIKKVSVLVDQPSGGKKDITEMIPDYEPQNGDSVTLKVEIELEQGHNFGEGSKLTYELPSIFDEVSGSGELGTVGTFEIQDGKVVVTFNGSIRDDADQGVLVDDASFSIGAIYSLINEEIEYVLKLPGQENITLNFKPKNSSSIIKDGTPENNGISSNFISWVVDVNTELNTLSNASFKDVLAQGNPGKHTYNQTSLKVIELIVNAKGEVTEGASITVTPNYNTASTELSFNLPDGKKHIELSMTL